MPRSNSTGPSRGRKSSSSRPDSAGKSGGKRSEGKPFKKSSKSGSKPFGKSSGDSAFEKGKKFSSSSRSFKKDDSEKLSYSKPSFSTKKAFRSATDDKPAFKKPEKSGDGKYLSKSEKAFKRFDPKYDTRKPDYEKGELEVPQKGGRSNSGFTKKDSTSSFEKGPKKFDSRKPSFDKKETPAYPKKRVSDSSFQKDEPVKRTYKRREEDADGKTGFFRKEKDFKSDRTGKGRIDNPETSEPGDGKIRLNRYISNSGVCSRREADKLITMGLISVNGKTITELGYKVSRTDEVRHENKVLTAEKPVYILMNKPKGFLTTTADPQERNTVMHIIGNSVKERVYPVGRLDRNTTGLLLLTNDGDLADKLMHPSYKAKKIYKVELDRPLTKADYQTILEGVRLEEGRAMVDDLAIVSEDKRTVGIELHIGWNRVVRRIFESLQYEVVKLDRSVYAGLDKKDLGRGQWRFLKREEIVMLKHYK
ncbi:MAG TPA: pseudouridine synthase [Chryseolinea sp.]|nr:pseudouridine synthase [Chryseolinea sp.]HPM31064.1 pseudouridine synthase [Chryseolinea sp.]